MYEIKPKKICAKKFTFELIDGNVHDVKFYGGCGGNQMGVAALAEGMKAEEVIARLEGIKCGMKGTSCPDQLAKALREAAAQAAE